MHGAYAYLSSNKHENIDGLVGFTACQTLLGYLMPKSVF